MNLNDLIKENIDNIENCSNRVIILKEKSCISIDVIKEVRKSLEHINYYIEYPECESSCYKYVKYKILDRAIDRRNNLILLCNQETIY